MPTHLVNLDALIEREDFESGAAEATTGHEPLFKLEELQSSKLYYKVLRKPDFQRDTSNWSSETIVEFVRSFLDLELIPALILWHSKASNKIFVIDGAHRLSALIAWVNDDYGDGAISRKFFSYKVSDPQRRFHLQTQRLMNERVGSFAELLHIGLNPATTSDAEKLRRGRAIATRQPPIQKVEGDAAIAERSFFKINGNQTTIDPTELDIIRARQKPNAIATRALMRAGTGHKYWSKFPDKAAEIERVSQDVYNLLFGGVVTDIGTQSPDVPRAGQPYSEEAFRMLFDMVNVFNNVTRAMWKSDETPNRKKAARVEQLPDDVDGSMTLSFLASIKAAGRVVAGNEYPGSLGLDQAVYSYGETGRFHGAAFIASIKFAQDVIARNKAHAFTLVRRDFEEFLVNQKWVINALGHSKGSGTRALDALVLFHKTALDAFLDGLRDEDEILRRISAVPQLKNLKRPERQTTVRQRISKQAQSAAVVRQILDSRERCPECHARLPPSSRSKDHTQRVQDGGMGDAENIQFMHPFCNTGRKEQREHAARKATS